MLKDDYYDHVLGKKLATTPTRRILFAIVRDFTDRRGLRHAWEQIDLDIQEEILETWLKIIEEEIRAAT